MQKSIAILGDYAAEFPPHPATDAAIEHSGRLLGNRIHKEWIPTTEIRLSRLRQYAGIWVAPGSPYKDMSKTLQAIQYARENNVPCLGTCGGFQHIVIEYARNVLGHSDAQHAEYDPYASELFISELDCSLAGRDMKLKFLHDSKVRTFYAADNAVETYYCNFGVNPDCVDKLKTGALKVSGADSEGEIRVVELPEHPFFIGTLFVPQTRSTKEEPHPLVTAFLRAALKH